MAVEPEFEQWHRNPEDLQSLSRWVTAMQAQSREAEAVALLVPVTEKPMDALVAASVYTALITLELGQGTIGRASDWSKRLSEAEPEGFRAPYFRGRILQSMGRLHDAKAHYLQAAKREHMHADLWQRLLDCCTATRDFERAQRILVQVQQWSWKPALKRLWRYKQGCIYQQSARYSLAMVCFSELILDCVTQGIPTIEPRPARLSQVAPEAPMAALRDAIALLERHDLQAFPTAGTLLGWWREGKFLSHDKDIDIMLPPGADWARAFQLMSEAPAFAPVFNEMNYSNFHSFVHRETRLVVDISHHEYHDDGQVQCVWRVPDLPDEQCRRTRQSQYTLVRDEWLGVQFWRPEDPDSFLSELYGDWRTPDTGFDTTISGHHLVGYPDVVRSYAYNRLADRLSGGSREKGLTYVAQILAKDPLDPIANHIKNLFTQAATQSDEG